MKTAVDFLVDEFKQKLMGDNLPDWVLAIIDQAKEMEKEQNDKSYQQGGDDRMWELFYEMNKPD